MKSITLQNGIRVCASDIFNSLGGFYGGFNLFDTRSVVGGAFEFVGYFQTRGEAIRAAMVFSR